MLVPEVWCRVRVPERDPGFLIDNGYLEKMTDFEWNGRTVLASRLGYRITSLFAERFLGRIFETPDAVFPEEMLRPEKQDMDAFAAGVDAIVAAQKRVAENYFYDGSVDAACPPLRALLHIMVCGEWEGMRLGDARLRAMFTREAVLASDWYKDRLHAKQERDVALWNRHIAALQSPCAALAEARAQLARVSSVAYLAELMGTIGADP